MYIQGTKEIVPEVREVIGRYLQYRQTSGAAVSSIKTFSTRLFLFERYLRAAKIEALDTIRKIDVEDFLYRMATDLNENRSYPGNYIRTVFFTMRNFFSFLVKTRQIVKSPAINVVPPKAIKIMRDNYFGLEEINEFFNSLPDKKWRDRRNKLMIELAYCAGLRLNEVRWVRRKDVNLESRTLYVAHAKGGEGSTVPLCVYIARRLADVPPDVDFIFTNSRGGMLSMDAVMDAFTTALTRFGTNRHLSFHSLRKSIGKHLLESGLSVRYVQVFLRHRSINTTESYTHIGMHHLKKAVLKYHPAEQYAPLY